MESLRDRPRPLTSPTAVGLAALTLVALAAASFTASLNRQLQLPRPVNTAKVVVMTPKAAPPPVSTLAYMAPVPAPAAESPARRRSTRPAVTETPPTTTDPLIVARAAPLNATDAAAIAPLTPPPAPEEAPTPPDSP